MMPNPCVLSLTCIWYAQHSKGTFSSCWCVSDFCWGCSSLILSTVAEEVAQDVAVVKISTEHLSHVQVRCLVLKRSCHLMLGSFNPQEARANEAACDGDQGTSAGNLTENALRVSSYLESYRSGSCDSDSSVNTWLQVRGRDYDFDLRDNRLLGAWRQVPNSVCHSIR